MSPPMSPVLPVHTAERIVRDVATARGVKAPISALFADQKTPAAILTAAWSALVAAGDTSVDYAVQSLQIAGTSVVDVEISTASDEQVVVSVDRTPIQVRVTEEHLALTLAQAFEKLRALLQRRHTVDQM
jgi:ribonuclease PH